MWAAIVVALLFVFFPEDAFAWGLVTHLQVGRTLLEQGKEMLAVYAPCILNFPTAYLYGSIAPDRFLAKNLNRYREHTHNWGRAFHMLRHAGSDDLKAFCLGYLSHLAADVVAHNLFVPMKIIERPGVRGRRHTYWELKFEHFQPEEAWELAESLDREANKALFDGFMGLFQVPSVLSFNANMRLTDNLFRVLGSNTARRVVSRLELRSPAMLPADEVSVYMDLCGRCTTSVLKDRERSFVTSTDPRGGSRISHARLLSKAVASVRPKASIRRLRKADGQEITSLLTDAAAVLPEGRANRRRGTLCRPYSDLQSPRSLPGHKEQAAAFFEPAHGGSGEEQ